MKTRLSFVLLAATLAAAACGGAMSEPAAPEGSDRRGEPPVTGTRPGDEHAPTSPGGAAQSADGIDVLLCDGKTRATFATGTPGNEIASALMNEWIRKNPDAHWETNVRASKGLLHPASENKELVGTSQGQTYGRVSEQDVAMWKTETERLALAGSRVFHSADELGSTVAVSCDMCHPHAENTHPETYPKFQAQLGRVVLLRDMINWCMQHPVRAEPLSADDPRMRAMEAYIYAQRRGKTLEYGKH
ncbi:hypothetical protein [Chondromyces crocatus]|uniref:Cytochrome c domain-containing protein n=1 Tax=Chondromyces crocatus TaxID=52 RepID=A0A0K1EJU4_CHOCO|nr:hypothetical protein [Chondromyces crocatus]AKT41131.1 uncharacterized protein CMC5_052920 [Chondromyces crocatus]